MGELGECELAPVFPVVTDWGDPPYLSLEEIGADFEFLDERQHVAGGEVLPRFIDAEGRRFRILVIALEVVLCVEIPLGFDPRELELSAAVVAGEAAVVELYRSTPHRGLLLSSESSPGNARALRREELLQASVPGGTACVVESMDWAEFDEEWFRAMDPAPPVRLWPIRHGPKG